MTLSTNAFRICVFALSICLILILLPIKAYSVREKIYPVFNDFPLPESVEICGERMPLEKPTVREMLDREFTINVWDRAQVFMWLKRSGRYFPFIENALSKAGMPDDLKYLAVAESSLITYIRSSKGALGTWQFMSLTAKRNGLRKDRT